MVKLNKSKKTGIVNIRKAVMFGFSVNSSYRYLYIYLQIYKHNFMHFIPNIRLTLDLLCPSSGILQFWISIIHNLINKIVTSCHFYKPLNHPYIINWLGLHICL